MPRSNELRPSRVARIGVAGIAAAALTFACAPARAGDATSFGDASWTGWSGVTARGDGAATIALPGAATFRYPDGPRGQYNHGFRTLNDSAADWHDEWGVSAEVKLPDGVRETELTFTIEPYARVGKPRSVAAIVRVSAPGWRTIALPWSAFGFDQAGTSLLRRAKGLTIAAKAVDGMGGEMSIRSPRVIAAAATALKAAVRGAPVERGGSVAYAVDVTNTTNAPQAVALSFVRYGWETMRATVEPSAVSLAPGATARVTVRVDAGDRVPAGAQEKQVLQAIPEGNAAWASRVEFVTTSRLPHPYVLHTAARWQEVKDKVARFDWAREQRDAYVARAEQWNVPEIAAPPRNDPNDNYGPFLFATPSENDLLACAYSWQLTGNTAHAAKVATFLKRLSDPERGYPATLRACNQSLVQEGHFFQHVAMAYDMVTDAGVLSDADKAQVDATLRMFMETIDRAAEGGSINNWNLSEVCGAFYSALVLQDLAAADRFFSGPSGIKDQLAKGTMDDGWWYECSISYNMWCASEFTQAALALAPFGYNFKDERLPANNATSVMLSAELNGGNGVETPELPGKPFGMDPSLYGPTTRPTRQITDLWDSLLPFIDYRGVMFGVNDSMEMRVAGNRTEVSGQPFEIAYYAFRDPRYAAMIRRGGGQRDLLYAVPELPAATPEQFRESAHADNVGLAMLRSQTPDRPMREQIQAVLHYGTHGWAHGHYDRTGLLSLMRYGRSFFNPEMVWHGYGNFLYKFYVQESVSNNMVVVDGKEQAATPGTLQLFHSGSAMQATVVDVTARWSYPPYGGMVYDYHTAKSFEEKTRDEGRSVPIPTTHPAYGVLSDFTEPILQRRAMVVTDDYVVIADLIRGDRPHTFDSLMQIKGFKGLDGADLKPLRHDAQWSVDPLGSAQFVTDADWSAGTAPVVARFETIFGPGGDDLGFRPGTQEPGVLKMDVHSLWPREQQVMVAQVPEDMGVDKSLAWAVRRDGKAVASGQFGAWILGKDALDVSVDGARSIELETRVASARKPSLFWANAVVVTRDGTEVSLASLPMKSENVTPSKGVGQDYAGGPIKIAGDAVTNAIAAEPKDVRSPAIVRVDLAGVDAVRLKAIVGADFPTGDESQRRKTLAVRATGTGARFLTVIEPYEDKRMVRSAVATGEDAVRVELNDGRVQEITFKNLAGDGGDVAVHLVETRDGKTVREETATAAERR